MTSARTRLGQELPLGILEDVGGSPGELGGREAGGIVAAEPHDAAIGPEQADEQSGKGRLPAAVGTDERHPFAGLDGE